MHRSGGSVNRGKFLGGCLKQDLQDFWGFSGWLATGRVLMEGTAGDRGRENSAAAARRGFGGGRCGGCPPAQGRAEGPTAHKTRSKE